MAESYIEMFEEKYYPPAFLGMALHTIQEFEDRQQEITEKVKKSLDQYMDNLTKLQEFQAAEPASEITLSFLYTSLGQESTKIQIDGYGSGGRIYGNSMLSDRFPVPWLTDYLNEMEEELQKRAAEDSLRRYIRPAELEKLRLRAVRSLLYYFSSRFRYIMADALDRKRLAMLQKEDTFIISMGEYQDWQKPVFALLPEIDIFNCEESAVLDFRRFAAVYYRDKQFCRKSITNARFTDCTFTDCQIDGCRMNDSIFEGCTFENVAFTDAEMIGCLFIDCDFLHVNFKNVVFDTNPMKNMDEYYEPAEFYRCGITEGKMEACQCSRCVVKDCDIQNLTMTDSDVTDSDFSEDDRIIWGDNKREVPQHGIF